MTISARQSEQRMKRMPSEHKLIQDAIAAVDAAAQARVLAGLNTMPPEVQKAVVTTWLLNDRDRGLEVLGKFLAETVGNSINEAVAAIATALKAVNDADPA